MNISDFLKDNRAKQNIMKFSIFLVIVILFSLFFFIIQPSAAEGGGSQKNIAKVINVSLVPIENISDQNYNYLSNSSNYQTYFKDNPSSNQSIKFKKNNYDFHFDVASSEMYWLNSTSGNTQKITENANNSIDIDKNKGTYKKHWVNIDLQYETTENSLNEVLIIYNLSNYTNANYLQYKSKNYFNNTLQVCHNNTCQLHPSNWIFNMTNSIYFKDSNNQTQYYMTIPIIYDSLENYVNGTVTVTVNDGFMTINTGIPYTFIKNAAYSVYIENSIKSNTNSTNYNQNLVQYITTDLNEINIYLSCNNVLQNNIFVYNASLQSGWKFGANVTGLTTYTNCTYDLTTTSNKFAILDIKEPATGYFYPRAYTYSNQNSLKEDRDYIDFKKVCDKNYSNCEWTKDTNGLTLNFVLAPDGIIDPDIINVSTCGTLDTVGGYYKLNQSITSGGDCFNVNAENIILDGNGYNITGGGGTSYWGIYLNANNITVKNFQNIGEFGGAIYNYYSDETVDNISASSYSGGYYGIYFLAMSNYNKYSNINLDNFASIAILIDANSQGSTFTNVTITNTAAAGLSFAVTGYNNNFTNTIADEIYVTGYNNNFVNTAIVNSQSLVGGLYMDGSGYNNIFDGISVYGSSNYDLYSTGNKYELIDFNIGSYNIVAGRGSFQTTNKGRINFLSDFATGIGTNLSNDIQLKTNSAYVNSDSALGLNLSANVSLFIVPTNFVKPKILRDGYNCPTNVCKNFTSLNAGTVRFNVTSWSNYSIGEYNAATTGCSVLNETGGTYTLTQDIIASVSSCIIINASGITLDGNGYSLISSSVAHGVQINNFNNITVKNLKMTNFSGNAIMFSGTSANSTLIVNNSFENDATGVYLVGGNNIRLINNNLSSNSYGFNLLNSNNISVESNIINGSVTYGVYLSSNGSTIKNNVITNSGDALRMASTSHSNIISNNFSGNTNAIYLSSSSGNNTIQTFNSNVDGYGLQISNSNNNIISSGIIAGAISTSISMTGSNNNVLSDINISNSLGDALGFGTSLQNNFTRISIVNTASNAYDLDIYNIGNNGTYLIDTPIKNYSLGDGIDGSPMFFKSSNNGEIRFLQAVNGTGTNLSNDIQIRDNFVYVNSAQRGINKSANISLYNVPTNFTNPGILKNGFMCPASVCTNYTSLNAGNVSFSVAGWSNYTIGESPDTTAPNITLNVPINGYNSSTANINFNWTATDDLDSSFSCNLTIDSIVNSTNIVTSGVAYNRTVLGLSNAIHLWNVTCWDSVGNRNTSVTYTLIVDTISPNITLLLPTNNSNINYSNNINFTANLSDNLSGLKNATLNIYNSSNSLVNQTIITYSGTLQTTIGIVVTLIDGIFKWFYQAFDFAGNQFTSNNNTLTIDTGNPSIIITYPLNTTYNINISQLNYTVSDLNLQACWYTLNNGITNTTRTCGQNATGLTSNEGSNIWKVYANDSAGNLNSSSVTFFKDTILPLIQFVSPTENSGVNLSRNWIYANVSAVEINEANITFNLYNSTSLVNSTTYLTQVRTINWTNLVNGFYYYNVSVTDLANNMNSSETRAIVLDTIVPNITLLSPPNGTRTIETTNNFTANLTDNLSGIKNVTFYVENSTGSLVENQTITAFGGRVLQTVIGIVQSLTDGFYNWWYDAFDWSGNYYSAENFTINITVDITPPTINFTLPTLSSGSVTTTNNIEINVTSSDTNLNTTTIYFYNSSYSLLYSNSTNLTNLYINYVGLTNGQTYYFNASANDLFGNTAWTEFRNVTINTSVTPPPSGGGGIVGTLNLIGKINITYEKNWTVDKLNTIYISVYNIAGNLVDTAGLNTTNLTLPVYMSNIYRTGIGKYYQEIRVLDTNETIAEFEVSVTNLNIKTASEKFKVNLIQPTGIESISIRMTDKIQTSMNKLWSIIKDNFDFIIVLALILLSLFTIAFVIFTINKNKR